MPSRQRNPAHPIQVTPPAALPVPRQLPRAAGQPRLPDSSRGRKRDRGKARRDGLSDSQRMAAQAVASAVRPCQPLQEVLEESQESIEEDLYQLLQPTQELPPSRSGRSRRQTASFNPDVEGLNDAALLAARRARGAP